MTLKKLWSDRTTVGGEKSSLGTLNCVNLTSRELVAFFNGVFAAIFSGTGEQNFVSLDLNVVKSGIIAVSRCDANCLFIQSKVKRVFDIRIFGQVFLCCLALVKN
jgi:hypothetical protein